MIAKRLKSKLAQKGGRGLTKLEHGLMVENDDILVEGGGGYEDSIMV
jgi:hypothetical protein